MARDLTVAALLDQPEYQAMFKGVDMNPVINAGRSNGSGVPFNQTALAKQNLDIMGVPWQESVFGEQEEYRNPITGKTPYEDPTPINRMLFEEPAEEKTGDAEGGLGGKELGLFAAGTALKTGGKIFDTITKLSDNAEDRERTRKQLADELALHKKSMAIKYLMGSTNHSKALADLVRALKLSSNKSARAILGRARGRAVKNA